MKLIDTHAHIQFDTYDDEEREKIITHCEDDGTGMMFVGCDYESSARALALAEDYEETWAAVGQHPTDSGEPFSYKNYVTLARSSKKVVAVGECGLDFFHLSKAEADRAEQIRSQKELFLKHIDLAHELHLPLIIHCRDAHEAMIELLLQRFTSTSSHPHPVPEHGVMHCFTGNMSEAQSYLDLGFLISFTGIITFATQYDEVVKNIPLEKICIETDSPYLTPNPHRGKKNSPQYVRFVAERIAEIRGISFDEVARQTTENAMRLFKISH